MKKVLPVITAFAVICAALICFSKFAVLKKAVKPEEIKNQHYYLMKKQANTAADWIAIGDENGYYDSPEDAELAGNYPDPGYNIAAGDNTFICSGEKTGEETNAAGYKNIIYNINTWDIMYPVDHNSVFSFILPKGYIYKFEF